MRMVGLWWYGWVLRKRTEGAWSVVNFRREESCEGVILGSGEKLTEDLLYGWCVHCSVEILSCALNQEFVSRMCCYWVTVLSMLRSRSRCTRGFIAHRLVRLAYYFRVKDRNVLSFSRHLYYLFVGAKVRCECLRQIAMFIRNWPQETMSYKSPRC